MSKRSIILLAGLIPLSACGDRVGLRPAEGASRPPKAATAPEPPSVVELLTPQVQARPGRDDDTLRPPDFPGDRFDLPPAG